VSEGRSSAQHANKKAEHDNQELVKGRIIPTGFDDPPKRFERREAFDSSVLMGATLQVHARRKPG